MVDPGARKLLAQVQLTASLADIYVVPTQPPNTVALVGAFWVANTDSSARTVTIRIGVGTLTAANSLMEAVSIAANTSYVLLGSEWNLTLQAGAHIQGLADSASKVTVTLMGLEQT